MEERGIVLPRPRESERVTIFGRSGSGKTELAKRLLWQTKNCIIVDTKLNEDWSDVGVEVEGDHIYKAKSGRYWWKTPESFVLNDAQQERFFRWAYRDGGRAIYLDELADVAQGALSFPDGLKLIATRGRSAGVGLWTTTQRPSGIPLFALSEATHTFVFELTMKPDKQRVEELCEQPITWEAIAGNHGFYYIDKHRKLFGPWRLNL